ncbi:polysaccharide deacetylase family protein [Motiliproteus sp. MSK22-1]|uniref:polysaccharide deacetylase family protein n=1 Tax=Motiliproteus sp. MSK22-1 TaxID=1897630 RepID=UPI0009FA2B53|nr:polysaccharide deacetylase family protein [Motiliproteus sp. MSK22-1]
MSSWNALQEELKLWAQSGQVPTMWWRDDDAQQDSSNLRKLSQLSLDYQLPLHLAVIPKGVSSDLQNVFADNSRIMALQHGYNHNNYAAIGKRKCELGDDRPITKVIQPLTSGLAQLSHLLGQAFAPVLVPPWNRLSTKIPPCLADLGFVGLSTLGPRSDRLLCGLTQVNVHIDIIDWKQRRFAGETRALEQMIHHLSARRLGLVDADEATGLMTHHLAHDSECWVFCQQLFEFLQAYPVNWLSAEELF